MSNLQADRLIRVIGGVSDELIEKAAPDYALVRTSQSADVRELHEITVTPPSLGRLCAARIAAVSAAAAVVIGAGAFGIHYAGTHGIGIFSQPEKPEKIVSDRAEENETFIPGITAEPENSFLLDENMYTIVADAAFDYVIPTEGGGYASIFGDEWTDFDYRDETACLTADNYVGELINADEIQNNEMWTNFPLKCSLYVDGYSNGSLKGAALKCADKWVVASVSDEERDNISQYMTDSLTISPDLIPDADIYGVYYVNSGCSVMPEKYESDVPESVRNEVMQAVYDAVNDAEQSGIEHDFFPVGGRVLYTYPMPVYRADRSTDSYVVLLTSYTSVYAQFLVQKENDGWRVSIDPFDQYDNSAEAVNEAYRNGSPAAFLYTQSGGICMSDENGVLTPLTGVNDGDSTAFRHDVLMRIQTLDHLPRNTTYTELSGHDINEIIFNSYESAVTAFAEDHGRSDISVSYPVQSGGIIRVFVFAGDDIIGRLTVHYSSEDGVWYANQYDTAVEGLTEVYRSGKNVSFTVFGSNEYCCPENEKSFPISTSVYHKPSNVYLYDADRAEPIHKAYPAESGSERDAAEWGIYTYARNISAAGITLAIVQKGGSHTGELIYGSGYNELEYRGASGDWVSLGMRKTDSWEYCVLPDTTSELDIRWGRLSEGSYRLKKEFTDFRSWNDRDTAYSYTYFEITDRGTEAAKTYRDRAVKTFEVRRYSIMPMYADDVPQIYNDFVVDENGTAYGFMSTGVNSSELLRNNMEDDTSPDELYALIEPFITDAPIYLTVDIDAEAMMRELPYATVFDTFSDDDYSGGEYGWYRLNEDYIINITDSLYFHVYHRNDLWTNVRKTVELLWKNYSKYPDMNVYIVTDMSDGTYYLQIISRQADLDEIRAMLEDNGIDISPMIHLDTPDEMRGKWIPAEIKDIPDELDTDMRNRNTYLRFDSGVYVLSANAVEPGMDVEPGMGVKDQLLSLGLTEAAEIVGRRYSAGVSIGGGNRIYPYAEITDLCVMSGQSYFYQLTDDVVIGDSGNGNYSIWQLDKKLSGAVSVMTYFRGHELFGVNGEKYWELKQLVLEPYASTFSEEAGYTLRIAADRQYWDKIRSFAESQQMTYLVDNIELCEE